MSFRSTLSLEGLYNFYREVFGQKGLKERTGGSMFKEQFFQLIFDGSPNGHPIVVQGSDLGAQGFDRTVSIRFEN